jgi:hypothetical protein
MEISRLAIVEEINCCTPRVVLEEICLCSGIKFEENLEKTLNKIRKYSTQPISKDYENDTNSLRIIARHVNPICKNWKRNSLLKAFLFLQSFEHENTYEDPYFVSGLQTPENANSLNACVLYRLCKKFLINVNRNTSLIQMESSVRLYLQLKSPSTKSSIKEKIYDEIRFYSNETELVNLINVIDKPISLNLKRNKRPMKKGIYSYEDYSKCVDRMNRMDRINRTDKMSEIPKNALEAIVCAALNYKIDITCCEDPYSEYFLMTKSPYFPNDKNLLERMRETNIHPDSLLNPYLNQFFNPNLPENMYATRDLISLFSEEVVEENNNQEEYYTSLQLTYLTETFIHGRQGIVLNRENTFLEKIEEKEYDEVIVFGIRNPNSKMRAYTYAELTDTFSNYKRFSDPISNELFSDNNIEKLYRLTQKDKRKTETDEMYNCRLELGEEIERIKIYMNTKNEYVEEFLQKYETLSNEGQEKVQISLNNLLKCAMYMRNWDGISDYPLKSEQTNFETDKQITVDANVTSSLITFEESVKNLKNYDLDTFILNLPLMQYQKEANTFVTSNDESEGLTIQDRIRIVRGGEFETMNSCIRLTSNKFCATAYYYMVLIGFRIPFSISEVSQIF